MTLPLQPGWDKTEKAYVVTSIFGYNENSREVGGKARNSAIPSHLDGMFHGDFRQDRPDDLSSTLGTKSLEEYTDSFPNYRIKTAVEIGFDTDGQTISSYEVQMADPSTLSPITLEGGEDETNPFRSTFDYDGTQDFLNANQKGPLTTEQKVDPIDGIEGVRSSIIFGGNDPYLVNLKSDGEPLTAIISSSIPSTLLIYYLQITSFYAFLDFVFMADGTKVVRAWDASYYPAHALYVGGIKRDQNPFRENIEWTVDGPIWEDNAFWTFAREGNTPGLTPFDAFGSFLYKDRFQDGAGPHPAMRYIDDGTNLSALTVEDTLSEPLFPF
jgi:hypothetical protein